MELYKGIAGSPITYLTADISANQTTISIADDSALPDAPNICTIGYGENLETIKYGAKSNGVLQNVTRGIEGTPRAWPAGTEVARFFTAYDHNAIIENFNSHLAESANKHIHSSGGNASDGYWTRFDDGTQECSIFVNIVSASVSQSTEQGLTIYIASFEWDFPKPFTETPAVTAIGDTDSPGRFVGNRIYEVSKNSMGFQLTSLISFNKMCRVSLTAKGRWK